ncbi:hypothetical protein B0H14DRAFT_2570385 [Mycena olivaceomarginata]|nr:hypothetical protein B0H14DRAFT_2570385 [Mycena olivaceomarginata]
MSAAASVIKLSPPSAAFVNARTNSLGPWASFSARPARTFGPGRAFKTAQCMGVVWVQNVLDYANPDVARLLVAKAWWQVSMPLMPVGQSISTPSIHLTAVFYMLSRNWMLCVPIICAMCLGLAGVCLSLANILAGNAQAKAMWLLVHLVGVFTADFLITAGTLCMLRKRVDSGLERTTQLINCLLRLVFESAVPPTLIAMTDLIMTQTLGAKLLWHLFMNIALGKVYVASLLYTLNSINEYRARKQTSQEVYSFGNGRSSRVSSTHHCVLRLTTIQRTNMELTPRNPALKTDQIFVQTQVATHVSPGSPQDKTEYISGDFHSHEDDESSDRARYGQ